MNELWHSRDMVNLVRDLHDRGALKLPLSPLVQKLIEKDPSAFRPEYDDDNNLCAEDGIPWAIPRLELIIRPGQVLMFSSDVIHGGALWNQAYDNYRVHIYYGHKDQVLDVKHTTDTPRWSHHYMEHAEVMFKTRHGGDGRIYGYLCSRRRNMSSQKLKEVQSMHWPM